MISRQPTPDQSQTTGSLVVLNVLPVEATKNGIGACPNDRDESTKGVPTSAPGVVVVDAKKRNVGRAARRRRRKLKEIQSKESEWKSILSSSEGRIIPSVDDNSDVARLNTNASVQHLSVVLPTDRSCVRPAVQSHRLSHGWRDSDATALQAQLGYVPGNAIRIAARSSHVLFFQKQHQQQHLLPSREQPPFSSLEEHNANNVDFQQQQQNHQDVNDDDAPVVVQLYPLVWREPHAGGKAGGRRFKSRKRKEPTILAATATASSSSSSILDAANGDSPSCSNTTTPSKSTRPMEPSNKSDMESNDCLNEKGSEQQCHDGDTMYLVVEPFPTMYWLTHPFLSHMVSQLEQEGCGIQWEQRLTNDPTAQDRMRRAHSAYGMERKHLLTDADVAWIATRHWESAFAPSRGVAGSTNFNSVKCIHAHTAHFLSGRPGSSDNCIGQWAMEAIEQRYRAMISTLSHAKAIPKPIHETVETQTNGE